jgi:hypothetical protein
VAVGRPGAMRDFLRPAALAASVIVVVACGASTASSAPPASQPPASGAPSGSPDGSPSPSTAGVGAIEHATGASDVILRYDVGGGLVPAGFFASQTPVFTLYGDGRVVFRNITALPPQAVGPATPNLPLRTARLSEEQTQEVLLLAIGQAGLGIARTDYPNPMIADAPSTTFTIDAGGVEKTVSIMALGMDTPGVPDGPARAAFNLLAQRLGDFDRGGTVTTDEYAPERYRGVLLEGFAGDVPPLAWPWSDVNPADFVPKGPADAFPTPTHTLTPAQVEGLGVTPFTGGFGNLMLEGPDKKVYSLAVRPLLPEDAE